MFGPLHLLRNIRKQFFVNHIALILLFTILYYLSSKFYPDKDENNDFSLLDSFHFSLVTQTTVGYGAKTPTTLVSKIINIIQLLTIYGIVILELNL